MTDLAVTAPAGLASAIRVALLHDRQLVQGNVLLLGDWHEDHSDCVWIDVTGPTQEDIEPLLEEWFRFHELAAEDALSPNTLPKYDSFDRYDFFVFRTTALNIAAHGVETEKLACFMGKNFLFTIHKNPLDSIDLVWGRLPQDVRMMERGVDFVLYSVLDSLVDRHFPLIDEIEERLDQIHELIFSNPTQGLLDELLDFKRDLNILRRQSLPQRELLNQISRGGSRFIRQEHLIYFRDLYDHMYRIGESIDIEREMATSTMEAYLSVIANRTNDIMKVLTIFSSILLPINFIAGIYGMNFEFMPELHWKYGYLWAALLMAAIAAGMLSWFGKKGWLWQRRGDFIRRELHHRRTKRRKAART
ncbi:MAG: magnesium/cobalt transporter CorA [Thermoanaerobaculia bacterium]|nr:magnesium/cobalt transporter CorA [Thermoanaerobaculia bacterium]